MKRTLIITGITIVTSVVVTTLAIDAADTLTGKSGTLLSNVISTNTGCPSGMTTVSAGTFRCVDTYEASPGSDCPNEMTINTIDSRQNFDNPRCTSESKTNASPWVNVTREQALALCARRGARLPTNAEWYQIAVGMRDIPGTCNTESGSLAKTGSFEQCRTESGVFDMIGNAWEWTTEDAIDGTYNGRALPESGYVSQVDQSGVVVVSTTTPDKTFYDDYALTSRSGAYGMLRGGFYGSKSDAGVFALQAQTLPTAPGAGIGFRCIL